MSNSMPTNKQVKKHKHRWSYTYEECMRCGGGDVRYCSCGEMEPYDNKPLTPPKKKSTK